ncbi:MAG: hypothetical protein SGI88_09760 [Candidatus Hydrogenedentes bacterium]|nr:hypothetical protein [Candidatus Hydrogenedentota bacterium]
MPHVTLYLVRSCAFAAVLLLGLSCGQEQTGSQEITETRTLTTPAEAPPANVSSAERLGMVRQPAANAAAQPRFSWTTPDGWTEQPATAMRAINVRPAGDPNSECYLTLLDGGGGGLAANVNRWRGQMGLGAIDDAAVAALLKKPLLGMDATYVEVEGVYGGMSGQQQLPDYKLAGLVLAAGDMAVFVKMTGPKAVIDQELPKFSTFCDSIAMAGPATPESPAPTQAPAATAGPADAAMPADQPQIVEPTPTTQAGSGLTWTAPAGWTQSASRPMREVSFTMGAEGKTECYMSKLGNRGGGIEPNINRWAGQMGLGPLTAEEIAALPKVTVLGKASPLVEFRGNYTDMSGASFEEYVMLGTIAESGDAAIFVKLVGPASDVEAEKSNFVSFCESLK